MPAKSAGKGEEAILVERNNGEVINKLRTLVKDNPDNQFYKSVLSFYNKRGFISANQIYCIEQDYERDYVSEPEPDNEDWF